MGLPVALGIDCCGGRKYYFVIYVFGFWGGVPAGIDIDCSSDVLVEDSLVDAGDDALCVKAGANWVGRHTAVPSHDIVFRNIKVGTGHGTATSTSFWTIFSISQLHPTRPHTPSPHALWAVVPSPTSC